MRWDRQELWTSATCLRISVGHRGRPLFPQIAIATAPGLGVWMPKRWLTARRSRRCRRSSRWCTSGSAPSIRLQRNTPLAIATIDVPAACLVLPTEVGIRRLRVGSAKSHILLSAATRRASAFVSLQEARPSSTRNSNACLPGWRSTWKRCLDYVAEHQKHLKTSRFGTEWRCMNSHLHAPRRCASSRKATCVEEIAMPMASVLTALNLERRM